MPEYFIFQPQESRKSCMKNVYQLDPREESVEFSQEEWNEVQIELGKEQQKPGHCQEFIKLVQNMPKTY